MEERDPHLSEAYHAADHPQPSTALDARILDAAREAVAPTRRRPAWLGLAWPLSTTAVLILGIALLSRMPGQAPDVPHERAPGPAALRAEGATPTPARVAVTPAAPGGSIDRPTPRAEGAGPPVSLPADAARRASAGLEHAAPPSPASGREAAARTQGLDTPGAVGPAQRTPEQWVEDIRRLLREGRTAEARKSLEELRGHHPRFVPPADLDAPRAASPAERPDGPGR
ncbi:MAG TPA: hypothetical protein PKH69_10220 [Thiobacillaceae bacterium]|nr:hypothetical protein [Thiobacillaceae bacterium]HNU64852.1 hypothetical protein [Thiobacillaceae bacterium]